MELHVHIIGVVLILLGVMHVGFPWYFNWKKELTALSLVNRQMFQYHVFFIALLCVFLGILNVALGTEIIHSELGQKLSLGLGVFWGIRAIVQFVGYSSKIWKGKKLETVLHIFFSSFWIYMSLVHLMIYIH